MSAGEGAFVQYPADDLLGIIALESQRAGAFVVGEDLGTVDPEMRKALQKYKLLSYRLLWFEDDPPSKYPELALAAASTHDLPTIAGVCRGSDFEAQQRLGMKPSPEANQKLIDRLSKAAGCDCSAPVDEIILKAHAALAESPSLLVTATLDDAFAVEERPNMPGTTGGWPNWSLALPKTLEEIEQARLPRQIAEAMKTRSHK
jgi:4-alpha-glucanotransferase